MSNKDKTEQTDIHKRKPQSEETREQTQVQKLQVEIEHLKQQLEQLQKEKADNFAQLQRVSADYANFQKRVPKQVSDSVAYEKEVIIRSLLPALDNFEHALDKGKSENTEALLNGIKMVYDQVLGILKTHDVEQIQALGQKFDPAMHSAIMQKTVPGTEDNIVVDDFAKGYKLSGRVIRPSRVAVNKSSSQSQQQGVKQQPESGDETVDTE